MLEELIDKLMRGVSSKTPETEADIYPMLSTSLQTSIAVVDGQIAGIVKSFPDGAAKEEVIKHLRATKASLQYAASACLTAAAKINDGEPNRKLIPDESCQCASCKIRRVEESRKKAAKN